MCNKMCLIFSLYFITKFIITNQECTSITHICKEEKYCQNCIRAHHCCVWCFKEDFPGYRCGTLNDEEFSKCGLDYVVQNNRTKAEIKRNATFADVKDNVAEAVQFSPAEYDLNLRLGEPINLTVRYRPAKNFPLDLYYLMDLTKSMEPDLETITKLGLNLTQLLQTLTKNHQVAFGSYIDKPTLPFYMMSEENFKNPCRMQGGVCEMGYLFKHRLSFTDNITKFTEAVTKSQVSANLDNLEGGMDALMQILLCGSEIGWGTISRKLVVIATDGEMHFAGDGLLSGSSRRNRHRCLIDDDGNYVLPNLYDYPSLEEIYHEIKRRKTNVIFAAKSTSYKYYSKIHELIPEATFVGNLTDNSTNILHLVAEGYYSFMKQVTLSVNTTNIPGLKVDFFADCDGNGRWEKTDTCHNVEENEIIDFEVQFLLTEYQDKEKEELFVEESQIDEKIKINLNLIGSKCNCPKISSKECEHGILDCGNCSCHFGWQGDTCSEICDNDVIKCRFLQDGILSLSCSNRGDCVCSQCHCHFPYGGRYCEYDCPLDPATRLICGGRGTCVEGKCHCEPTYTGRFCECLKSQENCKVPGMDELCSGNGACECNKCNCISGYSGRFCEVCDQCTGLCDHFESCVGQSLENRNHSCNSGNATVQLYFLQELEDKKQNCLYRYDKQEEKCDAYFKYEFNKDRSVGVLVQEPICYKPISAGIVAGLIVVAIIALGILIIIVIKGRNMYRDRIEYEKFMKDKEKTFHREQNPLYKSPIVTYNNPTEEVAIREKRE